MHAAIYGGQGQGNGEPPIPPHPDLSNLRINGKKLHFVNSL